MFGYIWAVFGVFWLILARSGLLWAILGHIRATSRLILATLGLLCGQTPLYRWMAEGAVNVTGVVRGTGWQEGPSGRRGVPGCRSRVRAHIILMVIESLPYLGCFSHIWPYLGYLGYLGVPGLVGGAPPPGYPRPPPPRTRRCHHLGDNGP